MAALRIFSLLELREYALECREQSLDRVDIERKRVSRRRFRHEVCECQWQAELAACWRENDTTLFGARRGNEADELQRVAVKRMTWISNLDGLAWCKTLFDRGSSLGGVSLPRLVP